MQTTKKIAVSGEPGSFSEEAGLLYAQRENFKPDITFAVDMAGVLEAVNNGSVELGIFPVVNSRGGLVAPAFTAMGAYTFSVLSELWLEVYQCLMVRPGVQKEEITEIVSHPQAIKQCERYLASHFAGIAITEWIDTARSAKDLAESVLSPTAAVIAPARAAHLYNLELIDKGIQDTHPNLTTFIIVTAA